jgi:GGDEF domain-containing protein
VAGQYGQRGFLLLLPDTGESGAGTLCRRLEGLVSQAPVPAQEGLVLTPPHVTFGVAVYPEVGSAAGLLCRAEERLAEARADLGAKA